MDKGVMLKAVIAAAVSSIVSELAKYLRSIVSKRGDRPKHAKKKSSAKPPKATDDFNE